jgi:hypothetical protein
MQGLTWNKCTEIIPAVKILSDELKINISEISLEFDIDRDDDNSKLTQLIALEDFSPFIFLSS